MAAANEDKNSEESEGEDSHGSHVPSQQPWLKSSGIHESNDEMVKKNIKAHNQGHPMEAVDSLTSWVADDGAYGYEGPSRPEAPFATSSVHTSAPLQTPKDISHLSHDPSSLRFEEDESWIKRHDDSLESNVGQSSGIVDLARAESTSTLSSTSEDNCVIPRRDSLSAPHSQERHHSVWRDIPAQTFVGSASYEPPRPTSVPNLQSHSATRKRKNGSEYPSYPNQSFATLHTQHYSSPHQPHPLRTRSSHPSQNSSYSSSASRSRDYSHLPSGAKTVGNTPAQSPGLFTPSLSRSRPSGDESEDSHYNTPLLHPSHLQAPIE